MKTTIPDDNYNEKDVKEYLEETLDLDIDFRVKSNFEGEDCIIYLYDVKIKPVDLSELAEQELEFLEKPMELEFVKDFKFSITEGIQIRDFKLDDIKFNVSVKMGNGKLMVVDFDKEIDTR